MLAALLEQATRARGREQGHATVNKGTLTVRRGLLVVEEDVRRGDRGSERDRVMA